MNGASCFRTAWRELTAALPAGLALFFGIFSLISLSTSYFSSSLDTNLWWADLRFLSNPGRNALFALSGVALIAFGLRPRCSPIRRWMTLSLVCFFLVITFLNSLVCWRLFMQK